MNFKISRVYHYLIASILMLASLMVSAHDISHHFDVNVENNSECSLCIHADLLDSSAGSNSVKVGIEDQSTNTWPFGESRQMDMSRVSYQVRAPPTK